jgi:hypothetical protein
MTEPNFTSSTGYLLTVEIAELGAELWPAETGRHGAITGSLAVLRAHKDGEDDTAAAFIRTPHAHSWSQVTEDFPPEDAAHWREHEAKHATFPDARLRAWLDEITGGSWHVNTPLSPTLHTHRYRGQRLEHDHADGDKPHGYYGHPEDHPAPHITGRLS